MAKGLSPTSRTIRTLREQGVMCDIVERFNTFAGQYGVRHDLFNIIDIIAASPDMGIVGVQCGSGSGHSAHREKILVEHRENTENWLRSGGKLQIWSWRKLKLKRGGKAMRWVPKIEEITLEML